MFPPSLWDTLTREVECRANAGIVPQLSGRGTQRVVVWAAQRQTFLQNR